MQVNDILTDDNKMNITVVEKNSHVGGRIWTVEKDDKKIEMGGEFIDGNFSNTLYYSAKF